MYLWNKKKRKVIQPNEGQPIIILVLIPGHGIKRKLWQTGRSKKLNNMKEEIVFQKGTLSFMWFSEAALIFM